MLNALKNFIKYWLWLVISVIVVIILSLYEIIPLNFWISTWITIEPWLWLIITLTAILLAYKIIIYLIKRYVARSEKIPKDATNGIILLVRIIVIIAIIIIILPALDIPVEYLIDISTIFATAVGFALTLAASNFVAGFYMILTNPYNIGDFISIDGSIEGLVTEIGLNYTKLRDIAATTYQIPNNKLLSANITNFKVYHTKATDKEVPFEERFVSVISDILIPDEITRYVFEMEITFDQKPDETIKILDAIRDRWEEKFGYKPIYFFENLGWRAIIKWALLSEVPETIINLKDEFLEDVWLSVYKLNKEGD